MRIAHIGNTAGIGSILAEEQRRMGLQSSVFVFDDMTRKMFGGIMINYNSPIKKGLFHTLLKIFDIWHYHYPYGGLYSFLKQNFKNRVFLKHYHGSDIRESGKSDLDFCLVSTPDLLKYAPNGEWLPNPINLAEIDEFVKTLNNKSLNSPVRIAHYPYYKNYSTSSSDHYSKVLNELKRENKCEIIEVLNVSHFQTLQMISSADIVIGKIMPELGWIGKIELETMALGKPVIAYVSDELYEKYRPPVYRTTKETLAKDLNELINDESMQKRLSLDGSAYIRKYHDSSVVSNKVLGYYSFLR